MTAGFRASALLRGARSSRLLRSLLVTLQALTIALSLQISGAAHRLADVFFEDDAGEECGREGSGDQDDSECPPGCPSCHGCAHAQSLYVPPAGGILAPPILEVLAAPTGDERVPPLPILDSVFRPPRV